MGEKTAPKTSLPRFRDRLSIGSELKASPFCIGRLAHDPKMVVECFDAGINFFFLSSDLHYPLYANTRKGLEMLLERGGGIRDDIVIAAVSYVGQNALFGAASFFDLLNDCPTLDRFDLLVVGGAYAADFTSRVQTFREALTKNPFGYTAKGVGGSFHDRPTAALAINHGLVDMAFIRFNIDHTGARDDLFPRLREPRSAPIYNFTSTMASLSLERMRELGLDDNYWLPDHTDYYRHVLSEPNIEGLLCCMNTPEELASLDKAMERGPLSPEEHEHLAYICKLDMNDRIKADIRARNQRTG